MLGWFKKSSRPAFNPAWQPLLAEGVWQYAYLSDPQRQRLHEVVAHLVVEMTWEQGDEIEITEEMKVIVSGVAALLTLGSDPPYLFPKLRSIILRRAAYTYADVNRYLQGTTTEGGLTTARLGEAWLPSPIMLSWRHSQRQARVRGRGQNLVLHEFAHHIDGLDGDMDGVMTNASADFRRRWQHVVDREFYRLVGQQWRQEATLLDTYGASNRAEFFAVATECFFEKPQELRQEHPDLYELLAEYYRQNPAEWLPPAEESIRLNENRDAPISADVSELGLEGVDAIFAQGIADMDLGEYAKAERSFSEVLAEVPDDAEVLRERANVRARLRDDRGAHADAKAALQYDPEDVEAMTLYAEACLNLGDDRTADTYIRKALRENQDHEWALHLKARQQARRRDFEKAIQTFKLVLYTNPMSALTYLYLGYCCEALGDTEQAARYRQRAIDLEPKYETDPPRI